MNENNALYHHGIKGQKWGIRRFEDENISVQGKMSVRDINKLQRNNESVLKAKEEGKARIEQAQLQAKVEKEENKQKHTEQRKKVALAGAAIVGTLLVVNAISKRNNGGGSVVPPVGSTPKSAVKPVGSQAVSSIKKTTTSQTGKVVTAETLKKVGNEKLGLFGKMRLASGNMATKMYNNIPTIGPRAMIPKKNSILGHSDIVGDELYHRGPLRWPAGSPDGKGGQFMADEDTAYANAVSTILKRKADKNKLDPLDKKDPDYEKKKKQVDDVYKNMLDREFSKNIEKQRQQYENKQAQEAAQQAKTIQDIGKIITDTANLVPRTEGKRVHPDYSNITDDEMNKYINRANLETRYAQAKGEEKYIKSGSEKTREALQTIGAIAGIGGSIAMVIANLRRRNN